MRLHSARIKSKTFRKETPYVIKHVTGHKSKDWIFQKAWSFFEKWGNIRQYFDEVTIETFDFTDSKKQKITEKIIEEIRTRHKYHDEAITPETHVAVMGESTFFEIMKENRDASPFFADNYSFMSNDMYYTDPYRGKRTMNFSCHVIKGMEGFVLIPKVFIEVRKF